ncbi:DHA2 family efflux MFS transporter permease subunit [Denitratisoma oestradiolicum]|uniref:Multidrug efflux system protein n=1 Tax=Denitratisoma oestradiolicum TaxID=311182 RepID=A0A6S6XP65_9PROT|nr:DHA2 family efflux MFS transporter permease subunit [Denitratisoma oestradiolicum]TWO80574.1 hypothetical protein CBW56_09045 [Denitratisoma oestradiolicum]CAB1367646.1 multidrug efflux system protein [Denitratisoma oestradiolicum]
MSESQLHFPPLPAGERLLATVAVSLAIFMYGLDLAVTNVSIPAIAGDLGSSISQGTWAITAYAVGNAIVIPLTGWLTARVGQVRLFIASVLLFTLASALCGLSQSLEMLVFFRCIQGIVSGPMNPLAMALLMQAYPPQKAAMAMGATMMTGMLSPALGPIMGGWITDNFSWPWIFYVNIPVGIFSAWVSWRLFQHRETPKVKQPVDYVGLGLLVTWVGALQIMLDLGREHAWFESSLVIALAVLALTGFAFFVVWEWYEPHPMVDLKLFTRPHFSIAVALIGIANIPYFGNVVLTPLWLQNTLGYTATLSGSVVMVGGIAMFMIQPLVARWVPQLGFRQLAAIGLCFMVLSAYMRAGFTPGVSHGDLLLPQLLYGIGTSAMFMPLVLLAVHGLPQWQLAGATGLNSCVRTLTTGFGTSIATTLWDQRTIHHHAQLTSHITLYDSVPMQATSGLGNTVGGEAALNIVERLINTQAQTLAVNDFNIFSIAMFLVCLGFLWLVKPGKAEPAGTAVHALDH